MIHALASALIIAAAQPDTPALMAPVNAWVKAFNTAQTTFPSDAFTDDCTVIDEFAPFAWGPSHPTVRQWYAAVEGLDVPGHRQIVLSSHDHVDVGTRSNVFVKGDNAYMTFHALWHAEYRAPGARTKHFSQTGLFTVVERKTAEGWRISANSWGVLSQSVT
jgi:ketosteroid isomerase-like protein